MAFKIQFSPGSLSTLTLAHGSSSALNLVFTLLQTLIFARTLSSEDFSAAIFLVSVGLYILPFHQIMARTNFSLFQAERVNEPTNDNQSAIFFYIFQAVAIAVSLIAPIAVSDGTASYISLVSLSLYINLSNAWVSEIQTSFFMTGRALSFSVISLTRRLISLGSLLYLFIYPNFMFFCLCVGAQAIIFEILLITNNRKTLALFSFPQRPSLLGMKSYILRMCSVAQAIIAEWLPLTISYPLFTARFGIGESLIILDTGMKLMRVTLTVSRVLSEAAFPGMIGAQGKHLKRQLARVLAPSAIIALPLAAIVYFNTSFVFLILLGPNHGVPSGVGTPLAIAIISSIVFQISLYYLGHFGSHREMRLLFVTCSSICMVFMVCMLGGRPSLVPSLWLFGLMFTSVSLVSGLMLRYSLGSRTSCAKTMAVSGSTPTGL